MDILRIGKISSVNYENGTARVLYTDRDNAVTAELPLLSHEYSMPSIDDLVLVCHLPNGGQAGVIVGPFWNVNHRPKESGAGLFRKDLGEDCYIKYQEGKLTIHCPGGVEIKGDVAVEGNIAVDGNITATGNITRT